MVRCSRSTVSRLVPGTPRRSSAPVASTSRPRSCIASIPAPSTNDATPFAHADEHCDRVGNETAEREAQCVAARAVDPLRVVDEHEHGLGLGVGSEQTERRCSDGEAVVRSRRTQGKGARQRLHLRRRQLVERIECGPEQLEEPAERESRLRLHATCAQDLHPLGVLGRPVEETRLPDAGLADEREHAARSTARAVEQRSDPRELADRARGASPDSTPGGPPEAIGPPRA